MIPSRYRRAIGVGEGDEIILALEENGLRLLTPRQAIRQAQELVRKYVPAGRSLAAELLEERRREAEHE